MFTHVLVPIALDHTGRGEKALAAAEKLVSADGQITFLNVQDAIPGYVAAQIPAEVHAHNRDQAIKAMDALAARSSCRTDCEVISGHAGRAILDFAESAEADCIVIASHAPGLEDYFLGSTAARVVRHAPMSVLVLR